MIVSLSLVSNLLKRLDGKALVKIYVGCSIAETERKRRALLKR